MKTTDQLIAELTSEFGDHRCHYLMEEAKRFPWFTDPKASAIERVMGAALWNCVASYNFIAGINYRAHTARFFPETNLNFDDLRNQKFGQKLSVWSQVKIDQYRADFVFNFSKDDLTEWVAIECDGHDFHDKTKEQAAKDRARDRHFQTKGLAIFRYTGSEIWKNASGCAMDAILFAQRRILGDA